MRAIGNPYGHEGANNLPLPPTTTLRQSIIHEPVPHRSKWKSITVVSIKSVQSRELRGSRTIKPLRLVSNY